jgi:hypothetical protein
LGWGDGGQKNKNKLLNKRSYLEQLFHLPAPSKEKGTTKKAKMKNKPLLALIHSLKNREG